jgi:hypothetical protein
VRTAESGGQPTFAEAIMNRTRWKLRRAEGYDGICALGATFIPWISARNLENKEIGLRFIGRFLDEQAIPKLRVWTIKQYRPKGGGGWSGARDLADRRPGL